MSEPRFGLRADIVAGIIAVFARYSAVEEVLIYGSRALGTQRPGSDIDLTLIGGELDLKCLNCISNELDDLLLPYMFDLSLYAQIENAALREHIERVGQVFYRKT